MKALKPSSPRSQVKKFLRIGCLSIFVIVVIIIVVSVGVMYSLYSEYNETKAEYASTRAERESTLIASLNTHRIEGVGGHFYIAFSGCDVYQSAPDSRVWNKVALIYKEGSYAKILTGCTHTDSWRDDAWLYISTCAQAIGAGGGCARGGTFRTQDGIQWFRQVGVAPEEAWMNALLP